MTSTLIALALTVTGLLCPTHATACWDEPNASQPSGYERIGGSVEHMPSSAVHISFTYPNCGTL